MERPSRIKTGWLRPIFSQRPLVLGMVVVSVIALCIVAFLQYRWTTQVSEASEIRMGNNLQLMMMDWHLDFYREFAAVCVALQVGPDSGARDGWNAYAQRYSDWRRGAAPAELVKDVYILESSQSTARFFRLGADAPRIDSQSPPEDLARLLRRLQARSSSLRGGQSLRASGLAQRYHDWLAVRCPDSRPGSPDHSPPGSVRRQFVTQFGIGRLDHRCVGP